MDRTTWGSSGTYVSNTSVEEAWQNDQISLCVSEREKLRRFRDKGVQVQRPREFAPHESKVRGSSIGDTTFQANGLFDAENAVGKNRDLQ